MRVFTAGPRRKRRVLALVCTVALLALAIPSRALAVDYYVTTSGSDSADGLSIATAWATLQHAADTLVAGDTVHVADGDYQGFDVRSSGSAGSPISFLAASPAVRISADNPVTPDGINVENAAYIVIDGFTVDGRTRAGVRVAVSQFVTVRNCRAGFNGKWGIFSGFADDLLIENNETHNSVLEHGIYTSNSGDRPVIRGNWVHDNYANGIHMNGDASAGGDGTISGALVERNIIHGNGVGGGSAINMDGVIDSVVRNNLLFDNHASGISLYRIDGATGATGNLVVNNTIINASDARWCVNINTGSTGNRVINNILYNKHPWRGVISIDSSSKAGFSADYNSVMDRFSTDDGNSVIALAAWQAAGYGANSFLATPAQHFLNPGVDFHLLQSSPARDAGTSVDAPGSDLDGGPRPVGAGFDIGAYELQLINCGDGNADPGEICGEPSLPACADTCTTCLGCICAANDPVCGDLLLCGSEQCETNGDCAGGLVCEQCGCINPRVCDSGISMEKAKLKLRSDTFSLRAKGEAVIAKPWTGVDPAVSGIRIVVDSITGSGGVDATLPGGGLWKVNGSATRWKYIDPNATVSGINKAVIKDRSKKENGRLKWIVKGKGGVVALPDVNEVRTAVVLGASNECASIDWNPPAGAAPLCRGNSSKISCR